MHAALRSPAYRARAGEYLVRAYLAARQETKALVAGDLVIAEHGKEFTSIESRGLRYWTGRAAEMTGKTDKAKSLYRSVAMEDMDFEDVVDRLSALGDA